MHHVVIEETRQFEIFFYLFVFFPLSANWDGIHDNETHIYGYTWAIGHEVCGQDVSMHIDPHQHLFDESEWTHQGLVTGVSLPGRIDLELTPNIHT